MMPHGKLCQQWKADGQDGKNNERNGNKGDQRWPCLSNTVSKNQFIKKRQPPLLIISVYCVEINVSGSFSLIMIYSTNSPSFIPGSPLLPNKHYLSTPFAQVFLQAYSNLILITTWLIQCYNFHPPFFTRTLRIWKPPFSLTFTYYNSGIGIG